MKMSAFATSCSVTVGKLFNPSGLSFPKYRIRIFKQDHLQLPFSSEVIFNSVLFNRICMDYVLFSGVVLAKGIQRQCLLQEGYVLFVGEIHIT